MEKTVTTSEPRIDFESMRERVENFLIESNTTYLLASNELITLKEKRAMVEEHYAEMKQSAHSTWKLIVSKEKSYTDKIDLFVALLKKKMLAFTQRIEAERREREAALQREADAKAETERKRLEKNAKANEKRGNEMNAEMYREAAANCAAPVIVLASAAPKAAGISTREVWKAEITNKQAFIAAAAADVELARFITIDVVSLAKAGYRELAGVRFFKEEILSVRG